jgi:transglutaminase-like putative cysteine protease
LWGQWEEWGWSGGGVVGRNQGIPVRYFCGCFFNDSLHAGEIEASHAWAEGFLPGFGWKDYDPTHRRESDTRYIKLATGRDYGDIRPVSGTFRGKGTQELKVEASIRLVE